MNPTLTTSRILPGLAFGAWLFVGPGCAAQEPSATPATTNAPTPRAARPADNTPSAPEALPGKGLAQHDFLYAGENGTQRKIFIVRKGQLAWTYESTNSRGEISDAALLANGNVLFAHQFGITEVSAARTVVWHFDAPAGTEIHTAQPVGKDRVLFVQNGDPAKVRVVNKTSGATEKEFEIPVANPRNTHNQFRRARLTGSGTLLVAHLDLGKVCEYDAEGKAVLSLDVPNPWSAEPLKNGNILVTRERNYVREITRKGETVWEFLRTDLPDYRLSSMQTARRLANGNTLINNWCNKGNGTAVQAIEVSPDKKLVWALRSWSEPDLGPSTTLQVLDEPGTPEAASFGEFK